MTLLPPTVVPVSSSTTVGPWGGLLPPIPITGSYVSPYGLQIQNNSVSMTLNVAYYVPFPIWRTTTFLACYVAQFSGASGNSIRACLAAESASGGPGALIKDFGTASLVTGGLTGITSTIIAPGPQMCYLGLVVNTTTAMQAMDRRLIYTNAGEVETNLLGSVMGDTGNPLSFLFPNTPIGLKGNFTFGAWTNPVAAATSTIDGTGNAGSGQLPFMCLGV